MLEQFEICLKRVNFYLAFLGLCPDVNDDNRTILQRFRNRKLFTIHLLIFNSELLAQLLWLLDAVKTGKSFLEITYFLPCITLCFVSNFKTFNTLYHAQDVNKFIDAIKKLELSRPEIEEEGNEFKNKLIEEHVSTLKDSTRKIMLVSVVGLLMFAVGPIFIIIPRYYETGLLQLEMPFIAKYPFNEYDYRIYPWIYMHQMFAAIDVMIMQVAPDCLFYTSCTFVYINFLLLQYDMERVVCGELNRFDKAKFKRLVLRHIELMRCNDTLENTFSLSIFVNSVTSSIIICATGFNALTVSNIIQILSFGTFFIFGLMQIFLYCYYGDSIERSSMYISDAIYHSQWYRIDAEDRKLFIIVMIRAQKKCSLTASGFFAMNLKAFTSILSNSWSYFALLKTMYHPE